MTAKTRPATKTDAYLYAQRALGIGDFDDVGDARQHWEYQRKQVGLLGVAMRRHAATPDQVKVVVDYCTATSQHVPTVWALLARYREALRWHAEQFHVTELEQQLQSAIEHERSLPDSPWLARLIRVRGEARAQVLAEWRAERVS